MVINVLYGLDTNNLITLKYLFAMYHLQSVVLPKCNFALTQLLKSEKIKVGVAPVSITSLHPLIGGVKTRD